MRHKWNKKYDYRERITTCVRCGCNKVVRYPGYGYELNGDYTDKAPLCENNTLKQKK